MSRSLKKVHFRYPLGRKVICGTHHGKILCLAEIPALVTCERCLFILSHKPIKRSLYESEGQLSLFEN